MSVNTDDGIVCPTDAPADLVPVTVEVHAVGNGLFRPTSVQFFGKQGSPSEESEGKLLPGSGHPSRREQFCGNALVARARLVKLTKIKKKSAGLSLSAKRGTLDFRDTYDCRKSKPIYMYLSGCVSVDEKYGAQQAEKEEKRKRNINRQKKKRRK